MKILRPIACALGAALTFGGCATSDRDPGPGSSPSRQASGNAESACMTATNAKYKGQVNSLKVVRSEFSEANSVVIVEAVGIWGSSGSERWRCLVSNDGVVEELTAMR